MAYSKQVAREYYLNYTKKGKKKGRTKGKAKGKEELVVSKKRATGKEVSKEARVRSNEECRMVRERIKAQKKEFMRQYREQVKSMISSLRQEMSARLKGMPKGPEKDALKAEYQNRIKEIQELKRQQTEQFNEHFKNQKEKAVNDIRAKYGLKPLASSSSSLSKQKKVELSNEQKRTLSGALEEVRKK